MSEFVLLYRGVTVPTSPEQMQKRMEKWVAWFHRLENDGVLTQKGHPLDRTGKVVASKNKVVTDGPFAEAKDIIGGYSIVEAKDLEHATELAKGCPILDADGSVEVRPVQRMLDGTDRSSLPA